MTPGERLTAKGSGLEQQYFDWLYGHIGALTDKNPNHSHWLLAEQLHKKPFKWFVPNDDNRAADGRFLRDDFCDEIGSWFGLDIIFDECSMLEMMIALAKRIAYEMDGCTEDNSVGRWFWEMAKNAGLKDYTDERYNEAFNRAYSAVEVNNILDRINNRTYQPNGKGGFFPLRRPEHDQRDVELWYQMSAYLIAKGYYTDL